MIIIKKLLFIATLVIFSIKCSLSYSADSGPSPERISKSNPTYADAKKLVKEKKFKDALPLFNQLEKDNKNMSNADFLNDYAFTLRNLKNFERAEKLYLNALKINPTHAGANEYLGELYLQTRRPEEAKKRLEVLKNCKCEEYGELLEKVQKYKQ
ncbi:MAG: tetratricopeptide repeat protein [Candidatus Fonsibacter sp.]